MNGSAASTIIRNSLFNILRSVIGFPVAFILTPFVIGHIGIRAFGVWASLYVLTQSAVLLDLGLFNSLSKFVAELNERRDFDRLNQILNSAFLAYSALAAFFLLALSLFNRQIAVSIFKAQAAELSTFAWLVILAAAIFAVQMVSSVFTAILQGFQRIDLMNIVSILVLLVHFVLAVLVLRSGYGVLMLLAAQGVAVGLGSFIAVLFARHAYPRIQIRPTLATWDAFRSILPLSFAVQCLSLQTLIFGQFDRLALSAFLGPAYAGYYEVAARPFAALKNLPLAVAQPLMPAVSEMQARAEVEGVRPNIQRIVFLLYKYVMAGAAPIFILPMFIPHALLHLWFGSRPLDNPALVALGLRLLAATYFVSLLTAPLLYIQIGIGHHKDILRFALVASLLHPVLTLILLSRVGFIGAPLGALIATSVAAVICYIQFQETTACRLGSLLRVCLLPVAVAVFSSLGALLLVDSVPWFQTASGTSLIIALHFAVFLACLLLFRYFDPRDRDAFRAALSTAFRGWWPPLGRFARRFLDLTARKSELV